MTDSRVVRLAEGCARILAGTSPDAVLRALLDEVGAAVEATTVEILDVGGRAVTAAGFFALPMVPAERAQGRVSIPLALASGRSWGSLVVEPATAGLDAADEAALRQLATAAVASLERCELRQARAELHTIMETVPAVIWLAHDAAASRITGSRFATELLRLTPSDNHSLSAPDGERPTHYRVLSDDEEVPPAELPLQRAARGLSVRNQELRVVFDDGSYFDELVSASPVLDAAGRPAGAVGTSVIITEQKQAEARAYRLAHQDPLTGLPNRLLFRRMLAKEREHVAREGGHLAVMLLDLDDFKQVNDTLGHLAGDELLVEVSHRLQQAVRRSDHVARLGGDEFAVLSATAYGPDDFTMLAQRLVQAVARPCGVRGTDVQVGVSIGMTVFPEDSSDPDGLLANADFALYAAKADGRRRWRLFDPSLQEQARTFRELDHNLRRAVEWRELELYYQPIVEIDGLGVVGVEALLRWNDPVRGLLTPADFLPYVERSHLLPAVTDWVIEAALADSRAWLPSIPLALNLPSSLLEQERTVERLAGPLGREALAPGMLTIEVTEAALAGPESIASLATLRSLGARIAVDEFGAGYSSIGRLRGLPVDQVKLDRRFLGGEPASVQDRAILQGMVTLASALGFGVVAEGVERRDQLALLRGTGCSLAQGYLFARPMPAAAITPWLERWAGGLAASLIVPPCAPVRGA